MFYRQLFFAARTPIRTPSLLVLSFEIRVDHTGKNHEVDRHPSALTGKCAWNDRIQGFTPAVYSVADFVSSG